MATQAQIDLKTTDALTEGEIDRVREILDFDGTPDLPADETLLDRIEALSGVQRQRLKAYIDDWDRVVPFPVERRGGPKGTYFKTSDAYAQVRNRTRVLLGYGALASGSGGIRRIGVGYSGAMCPVEEDIYS
jgi:hypothetical protein